MLGSLLGAGQDTERRWQDAGQTGLVVLQPKASSVQPVDDPAETRRVIAAALFGSRAEVHVAIPAAAQLGKSMAEGLGVEGWRAWLLFPVFLSQDLADSLTTSDKGRYKEVLRTMWLSASQATESPPASLEAQDAHEFLQVIHSYADGGEQVFGQASRQFLWWGPAEASRLGLGKQMAGMAGQFQQVDDQTYLVGGVPMSVEWAARLAKLATQYAAARAGGARYAALLDDTQAAISSSMVQGIDRGLIDALSEVADEQRDFGPALSDMLVGFLTDEVATAGVDWFGEATQQAVYELVKDQFAPWAAQHYGWTATSTLSAAGAVFLAYAIWNVIYGADEAQAQRFNAAYAAKTYDQLGDVSDALGRRAKAASGGEIDATTALGYQAAMGLRQLALARNFGALAAYQDSERVIGVIRDLIGGGMASEVSRDGRQLERAYAQEAVQFWLFPTVIDFGATTAVVGAMRSSSPVLNGGQHTTGTVVYQADWSAGLDGWIGDASWKTRDGMLINDATSPDVTDGRYANFVYAPFASPKLDIAVEAEIQSLDLQTCCIGYFGVFLRRSDRGGYALEAGFAPQASPQVRADLIAFEEPYYPYAINHGRADVELDGRNEWHLYRLVVRGDTLTLFIDRALRLEAVVDMPDAISHGQRLGLFVRSHPTQLRVRSFRVMVP